MNFAAMALGGISLAAVGCAVALLVVAVSRSLIGGRMGAPSVPLSPGSPVFLAVIRLVMPLGRWIRACLPNALAVRIERRLAQADLDDRFTVDAWAGLHGGCCALAVVLALLGMAAGHGAIALVGLSIAVACLAAGESLLRRRMKDGERRFLKDLPAYLDVLTVCVEAGATLAVALRLAVDKAPPSAARKVFARLLQEIRMGRSRTEALHNVARLYEIEALSALVAALVQSEGHGMSLGTVLRAQSQQRATERQLRAEKAAMKAPVKMLGPLVLCIFPCTFVVIAVPVLVRMFLEGG